MEVIARANTLKTIIHNTIIHLASLMQGTLREQGRSQGSGRVAVCSLGPLDWPTVCNYAISHKTRKKEVLGTGT